MKIDLNNCFPAGTDGSRKPLPKQDQFLQWAMSPDDPKYVAYVGGIGSGKTLIGCITVLSWAVMYPGDYLIARQFYPELRDTTYKTFLEICPPELILKHNIAEMSVKIRSIGGKISTILFRPLEEADKLRSLNLSGFLIDEASQVSEYAFMLLQGRLRGPGLRKGILVTNPAGHNWIYMWFVKKDFMNPKAHNQYGLIMAPSTENVHLPEGYIESIMTTWSAQRIKREIYGSMDAFEGQIYTEFRRDVHVIQPFRIPDEWTRIIGADHGYRNPTCWLWGAVDYDGNIYIYREFYESEWLVEEIAKGKKDVGKPGITQLMAGERVEGAYIDPSTRNTRGISRGSTTSRTKKGLSEWDEYIEHLPKGFPLIPANNSVSAGIEKVKSYLKIREDTRKPRLYIFNTCHNLITELVKYRYKEMRPNQIGKQNEPEEPVKADDHACDALRYLIMSRPEASKQEVERNIRGGKGALRTPEYYLHQTIKHVKKPKVHDPWGDS